VILGSRFLCFFFRATSFVGLCKSDFTPRLVGSFPRSVPLIFTRHVILCSSPSFFYSAYVFHFPFDVILLFYLGKGRERSPMRWPPLFPRFPLFLSWRVQDIASSSTFFSPGRAFGPPPRFPLLSFPFLPHGGAVVSAVPTLFPGRMFPVLPTSASQSV